MASQPAGFFNTVASAMPHLQETATKAQPYGSTVKRSSLDAPAAAAPDVKAFKPEVPLTVPTKSLSAETTPVKSSPVTSPLAAGPGSAEAQRYDQIFFDRKPKDIFFQRTQLFWNFFIKSPSNFLEKQS